MTTQIPATETQAYRNWGLALLLVSMGLLGLFLYGGSTALTIEGVPRMGENHALATNLALALLLGSQHCLLMGRHDPLHLGHLLPGKLEQLACMIYSALCMTLVLFVWQPIPRLAWQTSPGLPSAVLESLSPVGWLIVCGHLFLGAKSGPEIRRPWTLAAGWLLMLWAVPSMTLSHLQFSMMISLFALLAWRADQVKQRRTP